MPLWGVGRALESWVMSGFVEDFQVGRVKMKSCREDEKYAENRAFWRKFWDQFLYGPRKIHFIGLEYSVCFLNPDK